MRITVGSNLEDVLLSVKWGAVSMLANGCTPVNHVERYKQGAVNWLYSKRTHPDFVIIHPRRGLLILETQGLAARHHQEGH